MVESSTTLSYLLSGFGCVDTKSSSCVRPTERKTAFPDLFARNTSITLFSCHQIGKSSSYTRSMSLPTCSFSFMIVLRISL
jgi:hypothetical protein